MYNKDSPHKVCRGPLPLPVCWGEESADGGTVFLLPRERGGDGVDGRRFPRPHSPHQQDVLRVAGPFISLEYLPGGGEVSVFFLHGESLCSDVMCLLCNVTAL